MHCKTKISLILVAYLFLMLMLIVPKVNAHTITVPTNVYFGFGTKAYINFLSQQTFDNIYRDSNNIWHFDNYLFSVQNGNATVQTLMQENIIQVKVSASTGVQSITKIAVPTISYEPKVTVNQPFTSTFDSSTKIVTAYITHASDAIVTIDYNIYVTPGGSSDGGGGLPPSVVISSTSIGLGAVMQGTSKLANLTLMWSGPAQLVISQINFNGVGGEWIIPEVDFPLIVSRSPLASGLEATAYIPIVVNVPSNAKIGKYSVDAVYSFEIGVQTYTTVSRVEFDVAATPVGLIGIPTIVTTLLLIAMLSLVLVGFRKYK